MTVNINDIIASIVEEIGTSSWSAVSDRLFDETQERYSSDAVRGRWRRHTASLESDEISQMGVSRPGKMLSSQVTKQSRFDELISQRGLSPDDYSISGRLTEWEAQTSEGDVITMESVRVNIIPKPQTVARVIWEEVIRASSPVPQPKSLPPAETMVEFAFPDTHIGKIAPDEFSQVLSDSFEWLWNMAKIHNPQKIVFRIGDDLFNVDTQKMTTTNGTTVDNIGLYQDMIPAAIAGITHVCGKLLRLSGADIDLVVINGNHDETTSFAFYHIMKAYYRNEPRVKVVGGCSDVCTVFGDNMIVHMHGDRVNQAQVVSYVASKYPVEWGETVNREVHVGHKHKHEVLEIGGLTVRRFGSLAPKSTWESDRFPKTARVASVVVWEKSMGVIATYNYTHKN